MWTLKNSYHRKMAAYSLLVALGMASLLLFVASISAYQLTKWLLPLILRVSGLCALALVSLLYLGRGFREVYRSLRWTLGIMSIARRTRIPPTKM